jgi:paraquat-inducible protein B
MQSAIRLLDQANLFIAKDGTQKAPEQLTALLGDLRGFVGSPDVQAVPGALRGGLDDAKSILGDLKKADVAGQMTSTVDTLKTAASAFTDAAKGVPDVVDQIKALTAKLNDLPMKDLITSTKAAVDAVGGFMQADGMQGVPTALSAALKSLGLTLDDLRKGGAVDNLNAALDAGRQAAEAIAKATDHLPETMKQVEAAADNVNRLVVSYGANSDFGQLAQAMLREIQRTAAAVGATAKAIERNPQSFIFGR